MEIRRMGPIGAEISGVDVKALDEATFGEFYQTWLDCNDQEPMMRSVMRVALVVLPLHALAADYQAHRSQTRC